MLSTEAEFDLIVVGAGPAGSAAAYFASRAGLRVLLLDQCDFPRPKICSGGLSPKSLSILEEMDVLPQIKESVFPQIRRLRLGSPSGVVLEGDLPVTSVSRGYGYVVPRFFLDDMLKTQAIHQGAVAKRARVAELLLSDGRARGVLADGCEISGNAIIIAAGAKASSLLGRHGCTSDDETFFAIQAHYDAPPEEGLETLEMYFERTLVPGYFWIFPEGGGRMTVGACVWGNPGGARALRDRFEAGVRCAEEVCVAHVPVSESLTFERWIIPAHRHVLSSMCSNVLLAGDAGGFANPFTGEGIYYALETGRLAGLAVANHLAGPLATSSMGETYDLSLAELREDLGISWDLHDLMADADRIDALVADASHDDALRMTLIGAVLNASTKGTLTDWPISVNGVCE